MYGKGGSTERKNVIWDDAEDFGCARVSFMEVEEGQSFGSRAGNPGLSVLSANLRAVCRHVSGGVREQLDKAP